MLNKPLKKIIYCNLWSPSWPFHSTERQYLALYLMYCIVYLSLNDNEQYPDYHCILAWSYPYFQAFTRAGKDCSVGPGIVLCMCWRTVHILTSHSGFVLVSKTFISLVFKAVPEVLIKRYNYSTFCTVLVLSYSTYLHFLQRHKS